MNRRGFLGAILAAAAAPAIVRADSLMRIVPRDLAVIEPAAGGYLMTPEQAELLRGELGHYTGIVFRERRFNYGHGLAITATLPNGIPIGRGTSIGINDSNIDMWRAHMHQTLADDLLGLTR